MSSHSKRMLFEVAVRTPLRKLFTYESDVELQRGVRVEVPFRSRTLTGVVMGPSFAEPEKLKGLKSIGRILDEEAPYFDDKTLEFFEKAANYYGISVGELLSSAFSKSESSRDKDPAMRHFVPQLPQLSPSQTEIVEKISARLNKGFQTHLIFGETGSGKTEVYLKLAEQILLEGGQVLILVPEISLTPQLESRMSARMGSAISVFHSALTDKKRREIFKRAYSGQTDLFLGARSALFLPMRNLKLIIVDEEHDASFKQSERGAYQGRDLALLLAQIKKIPILLGSATPSVETFYRASKNEIEIHRLSSFHPKAESKIEIIDLKNEWKKSKAEKTFISQPLHSAIERTLEKKEQVLLFLNRRGSASQRYCLSCGTTDECKNCSTTLTIHSDLRRAVCHWCDFSKPMKPVCDLCGGKEFFLGGIGTKEVEIQIKSRFPEARIARLDRDETQKARRLEEIVHQFSNHEIDILIGTQMISKGIDISKLSMVGVILADQGFGLPDFRASERSFQLLFQLMGRAGRRGQEAEILVQTFMPEHPIFEWLQLPPRPAYEEFFKSEISVREASYLPPFSRLVLWTLSSKNESLLLQEAARFARRLNQIGNQLQIQTHGPTPAPLARLKGVYRMHLLSKAPVKGHMTTFLTAALSDLEGVFQLDSRVHLRSDRDPYQFM